MKKLLTISLSVLLGVSLFLFAGCSIRQGSKNTDYQREYYNAYVVYAEAAGDTVLSYEEWLATIKGDKGDKGDPGAPGDAGAAGVGIQEIAVNANGELVVTLTDGTEKNLGKIAGESAAPAQTESDLELYNYYKESYNYQGSVEKWLFEIMTGTLPLQYKVELSADKASFTYGWAGEEQTVVLGEHAILVDGRLSDEQAAEIPYVYANFNQAIDACVAGTEAEPMMLYVAPGVYWIADPDGESTTKATEITKNCAYLHMEGLTEDPRNVVIAYNYGHNVGFDGGNPTMFSISGDGLNVRNMTIGGFCNVDLEFPLQPEKNHVRRSDNVTQCQIGSYSGDKLYCENVRFISRLNMMPFINSSRALYYKCHMESTADSLNGSGSAVYYQCEIEMYASKTWGGASGVTLLDCDIELKHMNVDPGSTHYLVKGVNGRLNVIDCRFKDYTGKQMYNIGWNDVSSDTYRCYYSNVSYNGVPEDFASDEKNATYGVDLTGTEALKHYRFVDAQGNVVYNIYGILKGSDGWDPFTQKDIVEYYHAENIPNNLSVSGGGSTMETGTTATATLTYSMSGRTSGYNYKAESKVTWSFYDPAMAEFATLTPSEDGLTCVVTPNNTTSDYTQKVIVRCTDQSGLSGQAFLNIKPTMLEVNRVTELTIVQNGNKATVSYTFDTLGERVDLSRIKWYVCDDAEGANPVEIYTGGRLAEDPALKEVTLLPAWIGKYLKVTVEAKHLRSNYAAAATAYSAAPIAAEGVGELLEYAPDVTYMPIASNTNAAGYWQMRNVNWAIGNKGGFLDYEGLYFTGGKPNFSDLSYTPAAIEGGYGDMSLEVKVAPGKTAGQGFGSDKNFMDVLVKYDYATKTGYGVRIERASGSATYVRLVKYVNGEKTVLTTYQEEVDGQLANAYTSVYYTECTIKVWTVGNKLYCNVSTNSTSGAYVHEVELSADIETNLFGGMFMYYESSTNDNTTYIGSFNMKWEKPSATPVTPTETPTKVYLSVGPWDDSEATERYAAYFFNSETNAFVWVDMVLVDGKYEATVPEGYDYVIFVRMNGATTENTWDNKWNQTEDLALSGYIGKTFTVSAYGEGSANSQGSWS